VDREPEHLHRRLALSFTVQAVLDVTWTDPGINPALVVSVPQNASKTDPVPSLTFSVMRNCRHPLTDVVHPAAIYF